MFDVKTIDVCMCTCVYEHEYMQSCVLPHSYVVDNGVHIHVPVLATKPAMP